jgi:predicted nuclease of predicted toxin-antitoxin system
MPISPAIARWLAQTLGCEVTPIRELGLRDATDREIYLAARRSSATVMTNDGDFVSLHQQLGSPPQVIWLRCGNTLQRTVTGMLAPMLPTLVDMLEQGEALIEILDPEHTKA